MKEEQQIYVQLINNLSELSCAMIFNIKIAIIIVVFIYLLLKRVISFLIFKFILILL